MTRRDFNLADDGGLLREFAATRNGEAFGRLVERHIAGVYGAARRMMGDRQLAEDVTQGVFIVLARRAGRVSAGRPLAGWLYQVTHYACRNARRMERHRRKREREAAAMKTPVVETSRVSEAEVLLDRALIRLPARQRDVLLLRYAQEMSVEEIAGVMGMPVETVKKRLQRGLARLRGYFAAAGYAGAEEPAVRLAPAERAVARGMAPGMAAAALGQGAGHAAGAAVARSVLRTLHWNAMAKVGVAAAVVAAALGVGVLTQIGGPGAVPERAGGPVAMTGAAVPAATTAMTAATSAVEAEQVRVRELIYQLRYCVPTTNTQQTYAYVRELVTIGKPAVPELCAELDRATRDSEMRTLSFTLRAIGDRRAIPALIRAYPRTAHAVSDFGIDLLDRDLWQFVTDHRAAYEKEAPVYPEISVHRASSEITDALETMTGKSVGRAGWWGAKDNSPDEIAAGRAVRQEDADLWRQFWEQHGDEFITAEEADSVTLPARAGDPTEAAGVARYGALFPTGPKVRLRPVQEMILPPQGLFDNRAYLNFDAARTYALYEGSTVPIDPKTNYTGWFEAAGIDAFTSTSLHAPDAKPMGEIFFTYDPALATYTYGLQSNGTRTWAVENARWDTFEAEVESGKPLDLDQWGPSGNFFRYNAEKNVIDIDRYPFTCLFLTTGGTRGILQLVGSSDDPPGIKLRFRSYEGLGAAAKPMAVAVPTHGAFGPAVKVTLASPVSADPSALDLDTGQTRVPEIKVVERGDKGFGFTPEWSTWLQEWKGDLLVQPQAEGKLFALHCADMVACPVSTGAWEKLTADDVVAMVGRNYAREESFMVKQAPQTDPATWAFKTREGGVGILRVLEYTEKSISLEYKLVQIGEVGGR